MYQTGLLLIKLVIIGIQLGNKYLLSTTHWVGARNACASKECPYVTSQCCDPKVRGPLSGPFGEAYYSHELFPIICKTCLSHLCGWFLIEIFYTMALVGHQDYDSSWIPGHWTEWKPKPEDKEQRGTENLILRNLFYLAYPSWHCSVEHRGTKNQILRNLFYLAYPSWHCCTFHPLDPILRWSTGLSFHQ